MPAAAAHACGVLRAAARRQPLSYNASLTQISEWDAPGARHAPCTLGLVLQRHAIDPAAKKVLQQQGRAVDAWRVCDWKGVEIVAVV